MTKARRDGQYLVLLGTAVFLLIGLALENAAPVTTVDFRVVYYSARCLLEHRDPYNERELDSIYRTQGGESAQDSAQIKRSERRYNYLPTAFPITTPFAVLPFGPAHFLWLALTAGSIILASYLMWEIVSEAAPILAGALIALSLANSELFLILGNPAGVAVGFCVIAVWCFLRNRFVRLGIFCLAISLMLKPHDGGLVWLYFLLSGGLQRKRAWQTLGLIALLSVPALIWVSYVAPQWLQEFRSILSTYSSHGDVNDPGPASMASHGIGMVISLQAVFSIFRDDPQIYNPLTYLVVGGPLVFWIVRVLRARFTATMAWFALAPIAALTMLPVYHRIYDARLLLLSIPACAFLWKKGGGIGWCAVLLDAAGIALTGGMPWAILLALIKHGHIPAEFASPMCVIAIQVFPVPLTLLVVGLFFLWIFARHGTSRESRRPKHQSESSAASQKRREAEQPRGASLLTGTK
jgi:hypothetical protein